MGTATWTANAPTPANQKIVLHISSAGECAALGIASATCFVLPGTEPTGTLTVKKLVINDNGGTKSATDFKFKVNNGTATSFIADPAFPNDTLHGKNTVTVPSGAYSVLEDSTPTGYGATLSAGCSGTMVGGGTAECTITNNDSPPVCDAAAASGDAANAAYNNIPKDAINCGPPAHAFEGTSTKEFGDEVKLGKEGNLRSLTVLFNSYACKDFPLWNSSQCTTDPRQIPWATRSRTRSRPTSTLRVPTECRATSSRPQPRPSPSRTGRRQIRRCAGKVVEHPARWFNPVSGTCSYSDQDASHVGRGRLGMHSPIFFGDNVVWTVESQHESLRRQSLGPCALQRERCGLPVRLAERRFENV